MDLSIRRIKKNSAGFSLVEAMLGIAILAVVIVAMFQMSIISNRMSKSTRGANDFNALVNEIRGFIGVEQSCRLAMGGPTSYGGVPITGRTQRFTNGMGIYLYRPYVASTAFLADPAASPTPSPSLLKWNEWTINELKIQNDQGAPGGSRFQPVKLYIKATLSSEGMSRARASSEIRMTLELAPCPGGTCIVSCQNITYGTDYGTDFGPVCGANQALVVIGGRLSCKYVKCPNAMYPGQPTITGYDGAGNVTCGP